MNGLELSVCLVSLEWFDLLSVKENENIYCNVPCKQVLDTLTAQKKTYCLQKKTKIFIAMSLVSKGGLVYYQR